MTTLQLSALVSVREKLRVISLIAGAAAAEADKEALKCDRIAPHRLYSELIAEALMPFARLHDRMVGQMHAALREDFDHDEEGITLPMDTGPDGVA